MTTQRRRMVAEFDASIGPYNAKIDQMTAKTREWRREYETGFEGVDRKARSASIGLGTVVTASLALGGGAVIGAMTRYADEAKKIDNQLRAIGAGADDTRNRVFALAIETRTPIESTVGLLRNMQKSLKDQSLDQTIRQVGTLNRLLTIGGLDGAARGSVALQFGQALQSGILAGDELRSLREAAPIELLEAIAEAAGGTVEKLRDLGSQGKLTRDVMVRALDNLESISRSKFGDFEATLEEASEALRTALISVSSDFNEGLGATDAIAAAQQKLAVFIAGNGDAFESLGKSMKVLLEVALVLAGTRGLLFLGSSVSSVGAKFLSLQGKIGATGLALRGLRGGLSIFGGPVGLAIFAAGTAMSILAKNSKTTAERIKDVTDAVNTAKTASERYRTTQDLVKSDLEALERAERAVEKAIQDQAAAAEATARAEVSAIGRRITANKELLALQKSANEAASQAVDKSLKATFDSLAEDSRKVLDERLIANSGDGPEGRAQLRADRKQIAGLSDRERFERARELLEQSGRNLTDREVNLLNNLRDYLNAREEADAEILRQAIERDMIASAANGGGDGGVMAEVAAATEAQRVADRALIADVTANNAKLEALMKKRGEIQAALKRAIDREDVDEAGQFRIALNDTEEEIEKIRNVENRVDKMKDRVTELNDTLDYLSIDEDSEVRDRLETMMGQLEGAEALGKELDDVTLNALEAQFGGLIGTVERLLQSVGILKGDLSELKLPDASTYENQFSQMRFDGTGGDQEELVRATTKIADDLGVAVRDILAVMSFETAGTFDPWKAGPTTQHGQHRGLIQWGEPQRKEYGVSQSSSITEQVEAVGRYMRDRGVRAGDGLPAIYASVLAGDASLVNRGDINNGGVVRNITEATTGPQFAGHIAKADGLVSAYSGVQREVETGIADREREAEEAIRARAAAEEEAVRMRAEAEEEAERDRQQRLDEAARISEQALAEEIANQEAATRAREDYAAQLADSEERREHEAELIGKTASEQAYLTTQFELSNAAKAAGIDLDEEMAGSTATYREEIERLSQAARDDAAAQDERASAIEDAAERTQFLDQVNNQLKDGIIDAIIEGDNFADVLSNVAKMLAKAALEAALFGSGPFGGGGGGLLGGLFGGGAGGAGGGLIETGLSLFGFADGGIMTSQGPMPLNQYGKGGIATSPQIAIYGEGNTAAEAYVPLPDGRSIPVTMSMPDLESLQRTPMPEEIAMPQGGYGQVEVILRTTDGVTIQQVRSEAGIIVSQQRGGIVEDSVSAVAEGNRETKRLLG